MKNTRILLAQRPEGLVKPTDFEVVRENVRELQEGEVLIRQVYMSLDPAMRGWMDADFDGYIPPVELGETMRSFGIGVVESSRLDAFPVGAHVNGYFGWTEYAISNGEGLVPLPDEVPLELFVGVIGLPGATAYHGLMELHGKPKAGETILISGAAGSVGSIVGQIAKAEGMRVIGVTGSDEKRAWLLDVLGFDAVINYKTEDLKEAVAAYAPDGIDMYYENVGGEILQVAIDNMALNGRITMCGLISEYNDTERAAGPNLVNIIVKRVSMKGMVMLDQEHRLHEIFAELQKYLEKGQIKFRLDVIDGLEGAITGFNKLFDGTNNGKLAVRL